MVRTGLRAVGSRTGAPGREIVPRPAWSGRRCGRRSRCARIRCSAIASSSAGLTTRVEVSSVSTQMRRASWSAFVRVRGSRTSMIFLTPAAARSATSGTWSPSTSRRATGRCGAVLPTSLGSSQDFPSPADPHGRASGVDRSLCHSMQGCGTPVVAAGFRSWGRHSFLSCVGLDVAPPACLRLPRRHRP